MGLAAALLDGCGSGESTRPDDNRHTNDTGGVATGGNLGSESGGADAGGRVGDSGASSGGGSPGSPPPSGGNSTGGATSPSSGGVSASASGAGGEAAEPGGAPAGGMNGTAGSGAGDSGWKCPEGISGIPALTGTPTRIASVPPLDDFNANDTFGGNIEGPVWAGDALYLSEMSSQSYEGLGFNVKQSRILKLDANEAVSIFIADSGSNGLAVNGSGNLLAAVHKDGSLTEFAVPSGTPTVISATFMDARFNSPNDLTIRSDGNVYFSDPSYHAPMQRPQSAARVYRRAADGTLSVVADTLVNPNGVTLSLDESWLYVSAESGSRFPVLPDGSLGAGEDFAPASGGDGMAIDCAGNLYVTRGRAVAVYDPSGASLGSIAVPDVQSVTNVAFGGADRTTLYITGLGSNKGLFKLAVDIPGRPY